MSLHLNKAIGGYLELELPCLEEYHKKSIKLLTGRHCVELLIIERRINMIYMPYFSCDVLLEPCVRNNVKVVFYSINEQFEIQEELKIGDKQYLLYPNYFGLKSKYIHTLANSYKNIIIDNAQAFFDRPIPAIDTFYSARKFIGVADGAYLYTNVNISTKIEPSISINRFQHLIERIDKSPEDGYEGYTNNESSFAQLPLSYMSSLSNRILKGVNYQLIADKRKANFNYLHTALKPFNQLTNLIDKSDYIGPLIYPFWTSNKELRRELINNRIYIAKYWPNVLKRVSQKSIEYRLTEEVIPLPIDQRYCSSDMERIIQTIKRVLNA